MKNRNSGYIESITIGRESPEFRRERQLGASAYSEESIISQEREASAGPLKTQGPFLYQGFTKKKLGQTEAVLRKDFGMYQTAKGIDHN